MSLWGCFFLNGINFSKMKNLPTKFVQWLARSSRIVQKKLTNIFNRTSGTLPKNVINLPRTYEKLPCKGEQYRFSG